MQEQTLNAVSLVTGAGGSIGAAVARALAGAGSPVALVDSNGTAVEKLAAELCESGAPALACPADVTRAADVDTAVELAEHTLGPLGILVNVAGVLRTGEVTACTEQDWNTAIAVNGTGVFLASRAAARRMVPRKAGSIVTVASNAAGIPRAGMAAYAASKAAAVTFTKCLGLELAAHGIRCNTVCPGSTDTPMQRSLWPDASDDSGAARIIAGDPAAFRPGIPLGRLASPEDIADAVCFLVSPRARHITMQDLYVDGGATLRG
ncbi:2,3-dihydro-2,3-dihydroxybenzoate dehydrogenase [Streptomyces sp. NPDC050211]|uniref:2,3-dihydro-2,3-dihydroxybenzoate dehydrogenase n=1 Tax=Streptomyces sp. NPDC050211 TaxID=3154932 RepID=UPI003439A80E